MFKSRILPGAGITVVTFGCILLSRFTRVSFFAVLAVMAAFELKAVLARQGLKMLHWIPVVYAAGQLLLCLFSVDPVWMLAWFGLAAFGCMLAVILKPALGAQAAMTSLFTMIWPFFFFGLIMAIVAGDAWLPVIVLGVLGVWGCDSTALFVGKALGKHKLAPQVSPNKTWEGTIGGGLFAIVAGLVLYFVLKPFGGPGVVVCMVTSFVASCFGQVGDLAASLIKRFCAVKDYSSLIGEHGGIMDKMDGMLFALPAAWLCLYALGAI